MVVITPPCTPSVMEKQIPHLRYCRSDRKLPSAVSSAVLHILFKGKSDQRYKNSAYRAKQIHITYNFI